MRTFSLNLLVVLLLIMVAPAKAAIPASEREALTALYESVTVEGGVSGKPLPIANDNLPWLSPAGTECRWYGVSCDEAGEHVTGLNLFALGLSGTLPAELGQLTQLKQLWLFENRLSGAIPPQLGQLTLLQYLDISDNQLRGAIPTELGQLTQLKELDLSRNQLYGAIPVALTGLINLVPDYDSTGLSLEFNCDLYTDNVELAAQLDQINPPWKTRGETCGAVAPVAAFSIEAPYAALTVKVDASAALASPGRQIAGYNWRSSTGLRLTTLTPTANLTFTQPGEVDIELTVTDNRGENSAPLSKTLTILPENALYDSATAILTIQEVRDIKTDAYYQMNLQLGSEARGWFSLSAAPTLLARQQIRQPAAFVGLYDSEQQKLTLPRVKAFNQLYQVTFNILGKDRVFILNPPQRVQTNLPDGDQLVR